MLSFGKSPKKKSLPLSRKTFSRLLTAMQMEELPLLGQTYALSPKHFLIRSKNGDTLFHKAVLSGGLDQIARALKEAGHPLSPDHFLVPNKEGDTPLWLAATVGRLEQIASLLKASGQALSPRHFLVPGQDGQTPLHWALCKGGLEHAALLAKDSGQPLSSEHFLATDKGGRNYLFWAVAFKALGQVSRILRDSGQAVLPEQLLLKDNLGQTTLDLAIQRQVLDQIFQPTLWQGRLPAMLQLWSHVPEKHRSQIDFGQICDETALLSLPGRPRFDPGAFRTAVRPALSIPALENAHAPGARSKA
ncbi:MAG: ankyrin repeat domain-containing protein [Verrucomicrobium sp.]|nr:ankyrin repeat domain-containing protein [Verrucomicrobium sp.]